MEFSFDDKTKSEYYKDIKIKLGAMDDLKVSKSAKNFKEQDFLR